MELCRFILQAGQDASKVLQDARDRATLQNLSSFWFPRFADSQQERDFVKSVIDKHNQHTFVKVWFVASILVAIEASNFTFYFSEMSGASKMVLSGWFLKLLLVQTLFLLFFNRRVPVSSDSFICAGSLVFTIFLLMSDWWRAGAIFMADGTHLFQRHYGPDESIHRTDKMLLLHLVTLIVLTTSTFHVRANRSVFLTALLPLLYLAFSIPPGLCPNTTSVLFTDVAFLLVIVFFMWESQRFREVQLRAAWLRERNLTGAFRQLAGEKDKADTPDNKDGASGSWVFRWVGPHVYERLVPLGTRRITCITKATVTSWKTWFMAEPTDAKNTKRAWMVNATQFDLEIKSVRHCFQERLPAHSFCPVEDIAWDELELYLTNSSEENSDWKCLPFAVDLHFDAADWIKQEYDDDIVRLELPSCEDGRRLGSLKCVHGQAVFLFVWSPPAELRGMPLREFEDFLQDVIDESNDWECTKVLEDGTRSIVTKSQGDESRNMYDACSNMLMLTAARRVDASYAELHTDFGPADVFGSHVWGEEAGNTLRAIRSFVTGLADSDASKVPEVDLKRRIWFCTCCNNQSRVKEELGTDVSISPFARVIKSQSCVHLAVISPFLALSRKWCIFEFALGHDEDKSVALVTPSGIVQEGQVAPKTLHELASLLQHFSCADASCTSHEDESLIDKAINNMGGFRQLDANLKNTFRSAIQDAHKWTSRALQEIGEPTEESLRNHFWLGDVMLGFHFDDFPDDSALEQPLATQAEKVTHLAVAKTAGACNRESRSDLGVKNCCF